MSQSLKLDSDSDDDLITSTKRKKVEISDFKKILKSSSSARRKKQNYELLSTKIVKSQEQEKTKDKISQDRIILISFQEFKLEKHPEFIQEEEISIFFRSGLIDAIIKNGELGMGNLEFLEWLLKCAIKFSMESWNQKILNSLGIFLVFIRDLNILEYFSSL